MYAQRPLDLIDVADHRIQSLVDAGRCPTHPGTTMERRAPDEAGTCPVCQIVRSRPQRTRRLA